VRGKVARSAGRGPAPDGVWARAPRAPISGALGRYQGTARKNAAALSDALRGALGVAANAALPAERRDKFVTQAGDFKALGAILRAGAESLRSFRNCAIDMESP